MLCAMRSARTKHSSSTAFVAVKVPSRSNTASFMPFVGLSEHPFLQAMKLALPQRSGHNTANGGAFMANEEHLRGRSRVEG